MCNKMIIHTGLYECYGSLLEYSYIIRITWAEV